MQQRAGGVDFHELEAGFRKHGLPLGWGALLRLAESREHLNVDLVHGGWDPHGVVVGQRAFPNHQRGLGSAHGGAHVLQNVQHLRRRPVVQDVPHVERVAVLALGQ